MDEHQVFYDAFWPHNNSWTFAANLEKPCFFYTAKRSIFEQRSIFRQKLDLTETEMQYFRPGLPIRLCRYNNVSWESDETPILKDGFVLQADKIYLRPFGKNGTFKKAFLIHAGNPQGFTERELISHAQQLQQQTGYAISKGMGIYRLGLEKGLPLYYIGSYIDNAQIMENM